MHDRPTRESILAVISDLHKDVYGFRPRGIDYAAMTDDKLFTEYERVAADLDRELAREREEQQASVARWNSHLENMVREFGIPRVVAIRWDLQANGRDRNETDAEFYCYENGLPDEYEHEVRRALCAA